MHLYQSFIFFKIIIIVLLILISSRNTLISLRNKSSKTPSINIIKDVVSELLKFRKPRSIFEIQLKGQVLRESYEF